MLFIDKISQPSRAIMTMIEMAGIEGIELKTVQLLKGELMGKEFEKLNPNKKVPFYKDDQVQLFESGAIMRYLCNKHLKPDSSLYPSGSPAKMSDIEAALVIHHRVYRQIATYYFALKVAPMLKIVHLFDIEREKAKSDKLLVVINNVLQSKENRTASAGVITISDLLLYHEILQIHNIPGFTLEGRNLQSLIDFMHDVYQATRHTEILKYMESKLCRTNENSRYLFK